VRLAQIAMSPKNKKTKNKKQKMLETVFPVWSALKLYNEDQLPKPGVSVPALKNTGRWKILCAINHRQNPLVSTMYILYKCDKGCTASILTWTP
jgi:hypothetical protein